MKIIANETKAQRDAKMAADKLLADAKAAAKGRRRRRGSRKPKSA